MGQECLIVGYCDFAPPLWCNGSQRFLGCFVGTVPVPYRNFFRTGPAIRLARNLILCLDMSKPINLNKVRKSREKASAKAKADTNATFFGLSKGQKAQARAEREREERVQGQKKLQTLPPRSTTAPKPE